MKNENVTAKRKCIYFIFMQNKLVSATAHHRVHAVHTTIVHTTVQCDRSHARK